MLELRDIMLQLADIERYDCPRIFFKIKKLLEISGGHPIFGQRSLWPWLNNKIVLLDWLYVILESLRKIQ